MAVEVTLISRTQPEVSGGNLGATYKFDQYHIHWGEDDSRGSEHTINYFRYSAVNILESLYIFKQNIFLITRTVLLILLKL